MPFAVFRFETISKRVYRRFTARSRRGRKRGETFEDFRAPAYLLLSHYVDEKLQDAFRWLLMMNGDAPKKTRITLEQNPFHWGLLAMTSAAGTFLSPNKLRDLGTLMKRAHSEGVSADDFDALVRGRPSDSPQEAGSAMAPQAGEPEGRRRQPPPARYRRPPPAPR